MYSTTSSQGSVTSEVELSLHVQSGTAESKSVDVKSGAECLLMGWLDALGLSKGDLGCFMTYANLVPPYGSGVIAQKQHSVIISFLCDVLKSAIKSPHSLHEIRDELPGNKVILHMFLVISKTQI